MQILFRSLTDLEFDSRPDFQTDNSLPGSTTKATVLAFSCLKKAFPEHAWYLQCLHLLATNTVLDSMLFVTCFSLGLWIDSQVPDCDCHHSPITITTPYCVAVTGPFFTGINVFQLFSLQVRVAMSGKFQRKRKDENMPNNFELFTKSLSFSDNGSFDHDFFANQAKVSPDSFMFVWT